MVKKEIKQTRETYELAPADRDDIRAEAEARLAVYKDFAPEDMSGEQIAQVIKEVLSELGIEKPAPSGQRKNHESPDAEGKGQGRRQSCESGSGRIAEIAERTDNVQEAYRRIY